MRPNKNDARRLNEPIPGSHEYVAFTQIQSLNCENERRLVVLVPGQIRPFRHVFRDCRKLLKNRADPAFFLAWPTRRAQRAGAQSP
jgi:hypothetical protein